MKVIVCGAGQVGFHIAQHLSVQKNDVTVIDQSASLIRQISDSMDVQALVGYASDPAMLDRAGASDADLIVAVTRSDEVNMVACQVAYSLFNVPTKVARIRNQAYLQSTWADLFSRGNLPVDVVISPELEIAKALKRRLEVPGAFDMMPLMDGELRVLGIHLEANCPVVDTPLRQLTELFPNLRATVIAVNRGDKFFIPRSGDQLQVGDDIYLAVEKELVERAMSVFGHEEKAAQRIVIIGGGNIGRSLSLFLEDQKSPLNIKLIESDKGRATEVAAEFKHTVVLNGDALDQNILEEANIANADTIVSVTNDDEVNILSSLLAKRAGCPRAIALLNNSAFSPLVDTLGIDVALDPRETTVSSIVRHIRRGRIRDLYSLRGGWAEIIELDVLEGSEVAGKTLSDLKLLGEARFGSIKRGDSFIVPVADTQLEPGDRVVVLTVSSAVRKIEQLFSARADMF